MIKNKHHGRGPSGEGVVGIMGLVGLVVMCVRVCVCGGGEGLMEDTAPASFLQPGRISIGSGTRRASCASHAHASDACTVHKVATRRVITPLHAAMPWPAAVRSSTDGHLIYTNKPALYNTSPGGYIDPSPPAIPARDHPHPALTPIPIRTPTPILTRRSPQGSLVSGCTRLRRAAGPPERAKGQPPSQFHRVL